MSQYLYLTVQESTTDGWIVNLIQDGQLLANNIMLQNPLDKDQTEVVRWYLEDFLASSPYLIDKAIGAEALLLEYPKKLVKLLGLDTIILSRLRWNKLKTDSQVLQLVICQDIETCHGDSIHRLFLETLEAPSLWNSRLQVVVQRSLTDNDQRPLSQDGLGDTKEHGSSLAAAEPIHKHGSGRRFNVLLVVARDLHRNQSSMRQDVAPGLALEVLLGIKQRLQEQQHICTFMSKSFDLVPWQLLNITWNNEKRSVVRTTLTLYILICTARLVPGKVKVRRLLSSILAAHDCSPLRLVDKMKRIPSLFLL
jgi:hypothetical protein